MFDKIKNLMGKIGFKIETSSFIVTKANKNKDDKYSFEPESDSKPEVIEALNKSISDFEKTFKENLNKEKEYLCAFLYFESEFIVCPFTNEKFVFCSNVIDDYINEKGLMGGIKYFIENSILILTDGEIFINLPFNNFNVVEDFLIIELVYNLDYIKNALEKENKVFPNVENSLFLRDLPTLSSEKDFLDNQKVLFFHLEKEPNPEDIKSFIPKIKYSEGELKKIIYNDNEEKYTLYVENECYNKDCPIFDSENRFFIGYYLAKEKLVVPINILFKPLILMSDFRNNF